LTGPSSTENRPADPPPPPPDLDPAPEASAPEPSAPGAPPPPLGLTAFTVEGRRAPALFVVGWLGVIVGAALVLLAAMGPAGVAGALVATAGFAGLSIGSVLLAGSQTIEQRAAGVPHPGPSPVLVFVAVVATSRFAGYVVGGLLLTLVGEIPRPIGDLIAVLVQAAVFLGIVQLTVVGSGALSWPDMGLARRGPGIVGRELLGGAVFAGPVILVTSVVAIVAVQLAGVTPLSPLPPTGTPTGLLLHLLAGALIAPVAEEVLFRGFALSAWLRTAGARAAIVRSSILFVLAHVLFVGSDTFGEAIRLAFVGGIVRIPIAFTLGWLFVRTGSLWGPIGLHAAFNAVLITLGETTVGG
jgi:membrane protease YdiL (CAAX protease family)